MTARHNPLSLGSLALLLFLAGCGGQQAAQFPVPEVTVSSPEVRDVPRFADFNGTTRAVESVEVRARVAGELESVEFLASSMVEKDDLLFVIERTEYRAARDHAAAELASAKAELASAQSDEDRIQAAIQNNAVSQQDLDQAIARRQMAEASVSGAQARLAKAELDYSYTQVRSPIDGQVGRELVDVGNLVGSGENTLLTTVNKMDPIQVYFEMPEAVVLQFLQRMRNEGKEDIEDKRAANPDSLMLGDPGTALVRLANETQYTHFAYIDYIDNTVDPTTGTIEVRAVVPNEEHLIFPGLFVRIRVLSGTEEGAILVDERAIGTDLGGKYVLVIGEGNVVEQRYVRLGAKQEDGTVVVREGLESAEKYIVNGMLRARPGFPVNPVEKDAETAGTPDGGSAETENAAEGDAS